jgi:type I restriction enzyme S subunit
MNAEQLLQHFERISEAPDGIPRLRRFILDLAVRGKLVEQDPSDEPASELLKRIAAEKARLVKAGEIKKEKPLAPIEDADFDLPKSWTWTRLGKVTSYIQRGKSPKYAVNDGSLVVSQKCVQWSGLDLKVAKRITLESLIDYEKIRFLRDGDLLWNSTGTGTIGRIIKAVDPPEKLVCDSHVTVVRCLAVVPEYIHAWLRSDQVYALIEDRAAGSTNQVELTAQMAINQIVPLPPLAEQRRIVARVDDLMSLCDQLEAVKAEREQCRDRLVAASLQRLNQPAEEEETFREHARFTFNNLPRITTRAAHIKQLRQSILNLAMHGKLVPQDPNDEPASEQLKRIAAERTGTHALKKGRKNGVVEVDTLRAAIPLATGWRWTKIDQIALSMRYGTSTKCEYATSGAPVLRIPNVSDGVLCLDNMKYGQLSEGEKQDLALNTGDLLMIRSNGSLDNVGRSAVVTSEAEGMAFAGYLVRLRLSSANINPKFVWLILKSTDVRDQIEIPIRSTVGLKNVNLTEFGGLTFPLPPLAEQHRIVAKVDELMVICDQLDAQITATEQDSRCFLESVLADALAPGIDLRAEAKVA